jgi:lipopolysaccharide export system permease protein
LIPRIDRLVLKDIVGPWLFGVGLFASLLMAATYLGRIAGFIVDGVPALLVLELTGLLFPPILTKTFTMSVLLATLLGFSRLSSDSEIVALRAGGASVYRIIAPVFAFSLLMAIGTFVFNESFVPLAENQYEKLTTELVKSIKTKDALPVAIPVIEKSKLRLAIVAQNVDTANNIFRGVTIIGYDEKGSRSLLLFADRLTYEQDALANLVDPKHSLDRTVDGWKLSGNVLVANADLTSVTHVQDDVWPTKLPTIDQDFTHVTEPKDADFDKYTMMQLREFILFHRKQGDMTPKSLHNYEYGYWGKFAIPLAAIMFGVLGAALGIRSHRTGTASGYGIAIGITFLFVLIGNIMSIWAQGGVIPAWVAAFTPILIGCLASGVIMWRRNG